MRYLFDSSAINWMHNEPDREPLLLRLLAANEVRVSALTVAEVARTPDPKRRISLLQLLKRLTGEIRPLEEPEVLIRRGMMSYALQESTVTVTEDETPVAWSVLQDPTQISDEARRLLDQFQSTRETDFLELHRRARPDFQELFANGSKRPRSAAELLRLYMGNREFLWQLLSPTYESMTGQAFSEKEIYGLLQSLPFLSTYLLAWGYSVYKRAVAGEGYGATNAGVTDISYATYFFWVERFVTADRKQYRALRIIAHVGAPGCSVLRYQTFRREQAIGVLGREGHQATATPRP